MADQIQVLSGDEPILTDVHGVKMTPTASQKNIVWTRTAYV